MRSGRYDAAEAAFAAAGQLARTDADRRYAVERTVAVARVRQRLDALADEWLADPHLDALRRPALAAVLRERRRTRALLDWWRSGSASDAGFYAPRLVEEVIGAAMDAGDTDAAVGVARTMADRDPSSDAWLLTAGRLLLRQRLDDTLDTLLCARVDAAADDAAQLFRAAIAARDLGRDAVARAAASRLEASDGTVRVDAALLRATLDARAGDADAAGRAFEAAAGLALDAYPDRVSDVVAALEAARRDQTAAALLESALARDGDAARRDDYRQHLGSLLLLRLNRPSDAAALFDALRKGGSTPAARAQAGQRLIEIATATRALPALIGRLSQDVAAPGATAEDVLLLVSAQQRAGDTAGATATLRSTRLLDETQRLQQLAVLQLRARQFDAADATLRELLKADPASAATTWERLAAVAQQRNRPQDVAAAVTQIRAAVRGTDAAAETVGNTLMRLGDFPAAAESFERAIEQEPAAAELWLLWSGAMAKAGRAKPAFDRLCLLARQVTGASAFSVAVDGAMNLDASPAAVTPLRQELIARLALTPNDTSLLALATDMAEETKNTALAAAATNVGLAFDAEGRDGLLRGQITAAGRDRRFADAADYARTLVALGDDLPPQAFTELGRQFLEAGRPDEAARALDRALGVSADPTDAAAVAGLYARFGYPGRAAAVLRPVLLQNTQDAGLNEAAGQYEEADGRLAVAFDHYLVALRSTLRRPASVVAEEGRSGTDGVALHPVERLAASAAATAMDDAVRSDALLDTLGRAMLAAARPHDGASVDLANALGRALFRACVTLARPDAADAVLAKLPQSPLASIRSEVGRAFGVEEGPKTSDTTSATAPANETPATTTASAVPIEPAEVLRAASDLAGGHADQARQWCRDSAGRRIPERPTDETMTALLACAAAAGEPSAANAWAVQWVARACASAGDERPADAVTSVVKRTWDLVDQSARREMAGPVTVVSRKAGRQNESLSRLALRMGVESGAALSADAAAWVLSGVGRAFDVSANDAEGWSLLPPADRPGVMAGLLAKLPPAARLGAVTNFLAGVLTPVDAGTAAAVRDAVRSLPPVQQVRTSDWSTRRTQDAVLADVADAVARSQPPAGAPNTVSKARRLADAAFAAAISGRADRAGAWAADAIAALVAERSRPRPTPGLPANVTVVAQVAALGRALQALPAVGRAGYVGRWAADAGQSAWASIRYAVALESVGQCERAIDVLRAAVRAGPSDTESARLLADRTEASGRWAERATLPQPGSEPFVRLSRHVEAMQQAEAPGDDNAVDVPAALAAGDADLLARVLRSRSIATRGRAKPLAVTETPVGLGGLAGIDDARPTAAVAAGWPGAVETLWRALHAMPVGAAAGADAVPPVAAWPVDALAAAAAATPAAAGELNEKLAARDAAGVLTAADRLLLRRLASVPGVELDGRLVVRLREAAARCASPDDAAALAAYLRPRDPAAADSIDALAATLAHGNVGVGPYDAPTAATPAGPLPDAAAVRLLDRVERDRGASAAESVLGQWRATARVSARDGGVARRWARLAAERGDAGQYAERLVDALATPASEADDATRFPIEATLPAAAADTDAIGGRAVGALEAALARNPGDADAVRNLAVVGKWAWQHRPADTARRALDLAGRAAGVQGAGEQQLWVADLARLLDDPARAVAIEKGLLRARCLPVPRIVPLLAELSRLNDADAGRLTLDAALYCGSADVHRLAAAVRSRSATNSPPGAVTRPSSGN